MKRRRPLRTSPSATAAAAAQTTRRVIGSVSSGRPGGTMATAATSELREPDDGDGGTFRSHRELLVVAVT